LTRTFRKPWQANPAQLILKNFEAAGPPAAFFAASFTEHAMSTNLTLDQFNAICGALPHAEKVIQWMGSHVWKVGGKVFAIGAPGPDEHGNQPGDTPCPFTIKTDETAHAFLREEQGVGPAPHLPRGNWLRIEPECSIDTESLAGYIARSHGLIAATLTKAKRAEMGL
jgi:predicted DNA-binding protein (MmcQ/YjbR family)